MSSPLFKVGDHVEVLEYEPGELAEFNGQLSGTVIEIDESEEYGHSYLVKFDIAPIGLETIDCDEEFLKRLNDV